MRRWNEGERKFQTYRSLQNPSIIFRYTALRQLDDLQTRIQELNGIISASKAEISEKREQLKKMEDLEKKMQVLKQNQPLY